MNTPEQMADLLDGSSIISSKFNRFDKEILDTYFSEEGKAQLLSLIEQEVIGKDEVRTGDIYQDYLLKRGNDLRAEQRKALAKLFNRGGTPK